MQGSKRISKMILKWKYKSLFIDIRMEEFTRENLKKENFSNPNLIADTFFKIIQKSVLVSLFDKLKFRDLLLNLTSYEKDMLSIEIYELLHGNQKDGFDGLVGRSTRPHTIHRTDRKVEQKILKIRKQYRYCPVKIKGILQNQYKIRIGHMTVYRILCRNG